MLKLEENLDQCFSSFHVHWNHLAKTQITENDDIRKMVEQEVPEPPSSDKDTNSMKILEPILCQKSGNRLRGSCTPGE